MAHASAQLPLFLRAHPLSRGQHFHTLILWSSGLKEG